jgi:D-glycero-alpha-D-manno-heptose-7-phosphate kinase
LNLIDLRSVLNHIEIQAFAPCRLDCGGTLDLAPLALELERYQPTTITLATSILVGVSLTGGLRDMATIDWQGVGTEQVNAKHLPLSGPFALLNSICQHFGVSGFTLRIKSDAPVGSGLGGSGAAAVATIAALGVALKLRMPRQRLWIAHLAQRLENAVQASLTGYQDQLSAAFGGVNIWTWRYSHFTDPYLRHKVATRCNYADLSERVAIAFTAEQRSSTPVSYAYIQDFLAGRTREHWININNCTRKFGVSLVSKDWDGATAALAREMALRDEICPHLWPESALELRHMAEKLGCAVRTAGGNRAGCIWAFGTPGAIKKLRLDWADASIGAALRVRGVEVHTRKCVGSSRT